MPNRSAEMLQARILKSADGLKPSRFGKRVTFRLGGETSVTEGPFAAIRELIAGHRVWDVKSMDEALEWVKRCPDPMPGEDSEIEIRPFFGPEDFGAEFTPELRGRVTPAQGKPALLLLWQRRRGGSSCPC